MRAKSFAEFWPQYVRTHSRPRTRMLHALACALAVMLFGAAFATNVWLLIAVPLVGYSVAWSAHFFLDHTRPATLQHPLYSLAAEYRMLFLMMAGQMDAEVAKYASGGESQPDRVSPAGSPAV